MSILDSTDFLVISLFPSFCPICFPFNLSQSYVRDIEMGNKNPTIEIIFQLCRTLDISLKDFFDDDSNLLSEDPLIARIYRLNPAQREALLTFLNTID